ncbi:LOW QUALITY PROTEIN: pentatricopeptide repeat-containing protein At3g49740-like [Hibiscus syriacus]|uniref:LOW QUALITY PROTEIN: pentatricopeptide repeat-containing protein At3g49740-like n=1 Tax=Hibiscus syriacus TaxID=106335 RepID=UPI001924F2BA|nr:LOW QUALITY PROTEIN: pentatricopeptide repeat-containing protein At3g49740-like [Hibiscus syriacus]
MTSVCSYFTKGITIRTENCLNQLQLKLIKLNSRLANLTRSTRYQDALHLFDEIHCLHHNVRPDHYSLSTTLKACANLPNLPFGTKLHAYAIKSGFKAYSHVSNTLLFLYSNTHHLASVQRVFYEIKEPDVYSWTTMLSSCTKLGGISYACQVFDKMPKKEMAVWNVMVTGCMENGYEDLGFGFFKQMHFLGFKHDNYSLASVLSECYCENLGFGRQVQALVVKTGFLFRASVVNAAITMYFNCEDVVNACRVFEEVESFVYDPITFNVMIDGLMNVGRVKHASLMFREMLQACLSPSELTFVSLLSSCSCARAGDQVYAQAVKLGFEQSTSVSNAAITMYSSCGDLNTARLVFERLEQKDIVSWNTLVSTYSQRSSSSSTFLIYMEMQRSGIEPDEFTFGSLLSCSEFIEMGEMIHALVFKNGLISRVQVSNALVSSYSSSYSKHGKMNQACQLFQASTKNMISWNTIISGFFLNGFPAQGLRQLTKLLMSNLRPNEYTLSIAISICASISSLSNGKQLHGYILRRDFSSETSLGNALITMYAKCVTLNWSLRVFDEMIEKDTISWNALISAFAQHGEGKEAVHCFKAMKCAVGVKPDQATFTALLSACSHAGLVDDATWILNSMVHEYGFVPGEDHLSCMIDLLGRAGYLDEAERVIYSEHIEPQYNIWWTIFSACAACSNLRLARIIAKFLLEIEHNNPSVYVLLSNAYAAAGQWEDAARVRESMKNVGVTKQPGSSWISI